MTLASSMSQTGNKGLTSAARLTGGGSVVAWVSGTSVVVQRIDAEGHAVDAAQTVGAVLMGDYDVSTRHSVAATADGGWLIAWISPDRSVLFRRYDASGAAVGDAAPVDGTAYTTAFTIQARALADGGFVVAWAAAEGTSPSRAYLRRFSAAGAALTDRLGVSNSAGAQSAVQITPLADGNFLGAWVQGNPDGTESLLARRLDAALNGAGPEQVVQPAGAQMDPRIHRYSLLGATSVSQGAALFAWAYYDGWSLQVRWQLVDALGTSTIPSSSSGSANIPLSRLLDSVQAIPAATGFRIVAESNFGYSRGSTGYTTLLEIGPSGELLGNTETSRILWTGSETTGTRCGGPTQPGVAAAGGEDGHYLLAYATCAGLPPPPLQWVPADLEVVGR
jgi:hypothetical protein